MGIVNRDDALYWATGIDTSGLDADARKVEQIFNQIQEGTGGSVEKMKQNLDESMRAQSVAISNLEKHLKELEATHEETRKKMSGHATPETLERWKNEKQAIAEVRTELEGEKQDLTDRQKVYDLLGGKIANIRTQYNNLINEMARMRANGLAETEQYKEMEQEASKFAKTLQVMNIERKEMAKGGDMQGLLSGLSALSGLLSAGAGAMGLLNAKSEDYAKIQAKVQSMIAITIGLQQIQKTLYETSAFRVKTVTKAKELWNIATQNLTRSQMILMGVLSLGLLAAIGVVIVAIEKLVAKQKEQREEAKKLNEAIASNSSSQIANYERLRRSYNLLGDNIKAKEKFILENQSAFNGLGVSIHTVNEADNAFVANTSAFKSAIMERAKATATMELAAEKYKKVMEAQDKLDKTPKAYVTKSGTYTDGDGVKRKGKVLEKSSNWKEAEDEVNKETKEFYALIQKNISHTSAAAEKLKEMNINAANELTEGTKAWWESKKKNEQAKLDAMKSSEIGSDKWNEIKANIEKADTEIKRFEMKGRSTSRSAIRTPDDLSVGVKEALLKLEAEKLRIIEDGKEKRLKLSKQEWEEQMARLDREYNERLKKYKEQGKAMPDEEKNAYVERREVAGKAKEKRDTDIEKEFKKELEDIYKGLGDVFLSEEERKKKAIAERYEEERRRAKDLYERGGMTESQYEEISSKINNEEIEENRKRMLDGLDSFKQQEADAVKYWNERIAEIENDKNLTEIERINALKEAKKRYNDEINELNAHALTQSEEWIELFADTANLTDKEIDNLIKSIKDKLSSGEYQLNPIDAKNFIRSLEEARDGMKNPINQIISGFEAYRQAREKQADAERKLANWKAIGAPAEDIKDATDEVKKFKTEAQAAAAGIANAFKDAKQLIDGIGGAISDVAGSFGGDTRQLENVTNLLGGVATAGQGIAQIASGNPAEMISGIVNVVKGLADVIVSINSISDTERQKRIEKLAESVEKAKKKYEELGYAREKAFSSDKAKIIEEQNRLAEQQIADLEKMKAEEREKKNSDPEVIKDYERQQEELRKQMRENKEAAKEALVGTDLMSAIDQFAQAYADAWAGGTKAAESSAKAVKNIIKNALLESLKDGIKDDVDKVYEAIAAAMANDGKIDEVEQRGIDLLVEAMNANAEKWEDALSPYLDNGDKKGVTGELKAEMTEQTGSQLVGLWNMTAMDIRAIKEYFERNPFNSVEKELNDVLNTLHSIDKNTKDTANNTDGIKEQFEDMNEKLDDIVRNTKPNNSRG